MRFKEKIQVFYQAIDQKFMEQFGFPIKETTFLNIVQYLHVPKDSSSLAVTRILFGFLMLLDIVDERGGAHMDEWEQNYCRFPLIPFITAMPMPYMALVYAALWIGALGIMLGYKYRFTSRLFTVAYWYLFLVDRSVWNNHSYLFGLVGFLLSCTQAHCYWSLDSYLDPSIRKTEVPYWNYFLLKYQFFILYFIAGLKKGTAEWLDGYSLMGLAEHWVFNPFKLFLTVPQIDFLLVHCFIFVFDLTVAIWMMWGRTRHVAMLFCAMFHLMNSRLFTIGMFPYVCLATMPLYYPFDWPKTVGNLLKIKYYKIKALLCDYLNSYNKTCGCKPSEEKAQEKNESGDDVVDEAGQGEIDYLMFANTTCNCKKSEEMDQEIMNESDDGKHSKRIGNEKVDTKNYENNDNKLENGKNSPEDNKDKVLEKDTCQDITKEITSKNGKDYSENLKEKHKNTESVTGREKITTYMIMLYVFIQAFLPYSHFITKGYNNWTDGLYGYSWDMMVHSWEEETIVFKIVDNENGKEKYLDPESLTINGRWNKHGDMVYQLSQCVHKKLMETTDTSRNVSIYVDVWCSLNGRFIQRLFDFEVDLLKASWSPFEKVSFLMPLLDEALHWRSTLQEITKEVYSWSAGSDVKFYADFPGYHHEKYIPNDLTNVSLTVLEGVVVYEPKKGKLPSQSSRLTTGDSIRVQSGQFHKVHNIGKSPAYYMYTANDTKIENKIKVVKVKLPIFRELYKRIKNVVIFIGLLQENFSQMLFGCDGKC